MLLLDIPPALLSGHRCLVLEGTDSAAGIGAGVWKSRPHFHGQSRACAADQPQGQQAANTTGPLGDSCVTAVLQVPCWNRGQPCISSCATFPLPSSLSCRELQPAGKHSLPRASLRTAWLCTEANSAAGLGPHSLHSKDWLSLPARYTGTVPSTVPASAARWISGRGGQPGKNCSPLRLQPHRASEQCSVLQPDPPVQNLRQL